MKGAPVKDACVSAVLVPPSERVASMGVSPTKTMPLSSPTLPTDAMSAHVHTAAPHAPSRLAVWQTLEPRIDRVASYVALSVGLFGMVVLLAVL